LKRLRGGGLGGRSFTGDPGTYVRKGASLSTGALLGKLEGVCLPGLLREKKSITGFLSRTPRPLRF